MRHFAAGWGKGSRRVVTGPRSGKAASIDDRAGHGGGRTAFHADEMRVQMSVPPDEPPVPTYASKYVASEVAVAPAVAITGWPSTPPLICADACCVNTTARAAKSVMTQLLNSFISIPNLGLWLWLRLDKRCSKILPAASGNACGCALVLQNPNRF